MRQLKWFIINSVMMGMVIGWGFYDYSPAENITKFMIWFMFITCTISVFSEEIKQKARKRGLPVHASVSVFYDVVTLLIIVGWGSVFYGSLYLLSSIFQYVTYQED